MGGGRETKERCSVRTTWTCTEEKSQSGRRAFVQLDVGGDEDEDERLKGERHPSEDEAAKGRSENEKRLSLVESGRMSVVVSSVVGRAAVRRIVRVGITRSIVVIGAVETVR